jgi:hypothetical protein
VNIGRNRRRRDLRPDGVRQKPRARVFTGEVALLSPVKAGLRGTGIHVGERVTAAERASNPASSQFEAGRRRTDSGSAAKEKQQLGPRAFTDPEPTPLAKDGKREMVAVRRFAPRLEPAPRVGPRDGTGRGLPATGGW